MVASVWEPGPEVEKVWRDALSAVGTWQKRVSPPRFNPHTARSVFGEQTSLLRSAFESRDRYLETVTEQMTCQYGSVVAKDLDLAISCLPLLDIELKPKELAALNWETAEVVRRSVNCHRASAADYCFWHLLTLAQLRDGRLETPPEYLVRDGIDGAWPITTGQLESTLANADEEALKQVDRGVKNLLRHSGGIHHRKSRFLLDGPLPQMWWQVEWSLLATEVGTTKWRCSTVLDERQVFTALTPFYKQLVEWGRRRATRLLHPNCVYALALVSKGYRDAKGTYPKGGAATDILARLMRRTAYLSVDMVHPEALAQLAAE